MTKANDPFNLNKVLLTLSKEPSDTWTVDDALKGISVIGGTGSGKTTASGKKIASKFLEQGWGGLVLCAKTDEADLWRQYCKEANRSEDLIVFGKGARHEAGVHAGKEIIFNPVDYEKKRKGEGAGDTQNITNIFMNIYQMGNRISGNTEMREERFWDSALKRCLNRVIELLKLAGEDLSYTNMIKVVNTSNNLGKYSLVDALVSYENGEVPSPNLFKKSNYCFSCLFNAWVKHKDGENSETIEMVEEYFTTLLPAMGEKTKTTITESFMGLAEPFLYGILARHFAGENNIFPELIYEENKIIVLDFPIKEYLEAGIIAQSIFKLLFQQAIERRDIEKFPTPVFLWIDEAQYFINPYDQIFLTTARSSRTATVFLSQNLSNYFSIMGSASNSRSKVDSLMGNLSTKIFHANSDAETNEYASRLIGSNIQTLRGAQLSQDPLFDINTSVTDSLSSQYLPQVQPMDFTTLRTGGQSNNYKVDSIIMVSGRKWANGKNFLRTAFTQNFNN